MYGFLPLLAIYANYHFSIIIYKVIYIYMDKNEGRKYDSIGKEFFHLVLKTNRAKIIINKQKVLLKSIITKNVLFSKGLSF